MAFSAEFFSAMEIARRPVLETSLRVFASMSVREFIPRWYLMLYQIIRATAPALRRAVAASDGELREFFVQKSNEEQDHDGLLLSDLSRIGVPFSRAGSAPTNPWVAEMVGRQYYLIEHAHPALYLGFIGLLEGFPPTLEQIDAMQAASGFPAEAFSCARLHAKADIGHREELAAMLDTVPAELHAPIVANGQRCAALQCAALEYLSTTETLWTPRK